MDANSSGREHFLFPPIGSGSSAKLQDILSGKSKQDLRNYKGYRNGRPLKMIVIQFNEG